MDGTVLPQSGDRPNPSPIVITGMTAGFAANAARADRTVVVGGVAHDEAEG
jgi:hypothetical protein